MGETPIPHSEWRNSATPRVATRHQSLKRGRTGTNGKPNAGKPQAQPPWLDNERALEPSSSRNWPTWVIGQVQNGQGLGLDDDTSIQPFTQISPGGKHGPTAAITNSWNGETIHGSPPRDRYGEQAARPEALDG